MTKRGTVINKDQCQLPVMPNFSEGTIRLKGVSISKRARLWLKRVLSAPTKRWLKNLVAQISNSRFGKNHYSENPSCFPGRIFQPGDRVKVRSKDEITATLDHWGELKHCRFMDSMWQYCGSTQTVFKSVERFIDERDYQLKKVSGVVLLENSTCSGSLDYGRCDRSCYYFWRVEWLEKL